MVSFYDLFRDRFVPIQQQLILENAKQIALKRGAHTLDYQQARVVVYSSNPTEVSITPASETRFYATLYWLEADANVAINDKFSLDYVQYTITGVKMTMLGKIAYAQQNL